MTASDSKMKQRRELFESGLPVWKIAKKLGLSLNRCYQIRRELTGEKREYGNYPVIATSVTDPTNVLYFSSRSEAARKLHFDIHYTTVRIRRIIDQETPWQGYYWQKGYKADVKCGQGSITV